MLFELYEILDAPCCFCGYNGPGYYQAHTHSENCPFYEIGGGEERKHALVVWGKKRMLGVSGYATSVCACCINSCDKKLTDCQNSGG